MHVTWMPPTKQNKSVLSENNLKIKKTETTNRKQKTEHFNTKILCLFAFFLLNKKQKTLENKKQQCWCFFL